MKISLKNTKESPHVIIHLENIPETHQTSSVPAPPKPFVPSAAPIEADELLPDNITIEDTKLETNSYPEGPPAVSLPQVEVAKTESEIYEYFEVEKVPERLENVIPEYPEVARKAGIYGTVTLKVLVTNSGAVDSVEVLDGASVFRKSAIEAAKATKFSPAMFNDKAVSCWVIMPYKFVLK
jgi:protein TonB